MIGIILTFNYENDKDYNYLSGVLIDTYLAYNYMKPKCSEIFVFTDILKDYCTIFKMSLIYNDINVFIKLLKSKNEYYYFHNLENIKNKLTQLFNEYNDIIFYYSGHSELNGFVIPYIDSNVTLLNERKREIFLFEEFHNIIKTSKMCNNLFIILDCCHCSSLFLPYHLYGEVFRKTQKNYVNKNIIILNSCKNNETTINSKDGSIFSRILFKILIQQDERNIINIYKNVEQELSSWSNIQVYSSFPNLKEIL